MRWRGIAWCCIGCGGGEGVKLIVSRRAIMTHFGGKSASKIDPPLTHLPVSWMSEASVINAETLLDLPLGGVWLDADGGSIFTAG